VSSLSARDAYRLWAPHYKAETAVSFLEDGLVAALGAPTTGRRLLDVGCGTGRRLRVARASLAVGVDLAPEMLAWVGPAPALAAADVRALPFAAGTFDVVWCRLVIGHVRDLAGAYAELARVCRRGGDVVVTDFHPAAVAAGHRRTFRDTLGTVREVEHFVHRTSGHERAARFAGLELVDCREACVGPAVRAFYAAADRLDAYDAQRGLSLVLALAFRKAT
jgi:malonyl-CoA O-methyltransferase